MKKVLIFGSSGYGKKVLYMLDSKEYETIAFLDNNEDVIGKSLVGIPIDHPRNIYKYSFDFVIISVATYELEIKQQLLDAGVEEAKISVFLPNDKGICFQDERIAMMRACMDRLKETNIPGDLAELGVYKGDFAQYLNRYMPDKKLYLFDTFQGFDPKDKRQEKILKNNNRFDDTSLEEVLAKMTNKENVIIKKGYFPNSLEGLESTFCFVSLDADLYNPILEGLDYFYPRLEKGGYIFIHDVGTLAWPGCKKAVDEYCKIHEINYVPIMDRCLSVIISK